MITRLFVILVAAAVAAPLVADSFDADFTAATMRVDIQHVRGPRREAAVTQHIRHDGPWPGSRTHLIELTQGDYFFVVRDHSTQRRLFALGYNSNFSRETEPATVDTLRFPYPRRSVDVALYARSPRYELWRATIDPADPNIDRAPPLTATTKTVMEQGPPATMLDIAILADGYLASEETTFDRDARRAIDYLLSVAPYSDAAVSMNIRTVFVPSQESGITSPLDNRWRRTAFATTYNSHRSERRLEVGDSVRLRDAAATVPYDTIIVLANSDRYGAVGLYNNYNVVAINNTWWKYLVVHEFAHSLAGLEDEYFTLATCSRKRKAEPWAANVTAQAKRHKLKWRNLVSTSTPLPTPWQRDAYAAFDNDFARTYFALRDRRASESDVDAHIERSLPEMMRRLRTEKYHDTVGAFEGAASEKCGIYRPETDCTMFTLRADYFCAVCRRAILAAVRRFAE